ncbi:MAG: sulfatase [Dehalococcoidia bacterium]|nr:sulfatase [Dehalococcoidia bacterium]
MSSHPNLVYVFPDEYRKQAVGVANQDPVITPNLDAFAEESLMFTDAISNRPVCSPHRAMLFSGKYPHSNGVLGNVNSSTVQYENYLKEDERCFSDVLHDAGYAQGYIGKLHLDPPNEQAHYTEGARGDGRVWDSYTPPGSRRHGFDFWHSYGCCDWHNQPHYWHGDARIDQRLEVHEWSVKHETDVAVDYIENQTGWRDPDKPFSLFVSYNPPHMPFDQVPAEYVERYGDATHEDLLTRPNVPSDERGDRARQDVKNYFAMVTGVDEHFGRILTTLKEQGLDDDTIVVFTSDHGEMMGSHGLMGKSVWYEESMAIPLMVRWPDRIQPGRDDLLIGTADLTTTLLSLTGHADQIPQEMQGNDYAKALLGETLERPTSALYLETHPGRPEDGRRGVRTHRHTYVAERSSDGAETETLYDNLADAYQMENVADEQKDLAAELRDEMDGWLRETGDPWIED